MIFTDDGVDLPERLLQSLISDRLVVFVGAGVSMQAYKEQPPNTYYPGFRKLAELIAQRLSRCITEQEKRFLKDGYIDRVLGEWDDQKGDVRRHATIILQENESGQQLELHRAIIRLFTGNPTPRIVTTNFDRLLIRALEAEDLMLDSRWGISVAPALLPARRFSGICYLHGRVDEPHDIVLTDKDIGRAYMDEGWALRFAHSIFQRFDVLFVGYSLEDPPLRYLSLAIERTAERHRWAFLPEPPDTSNKSQKESDWQRRHVEAIWYSANDSDYRALERTIDAWGADNSRSFLDRRNVLSRIGTAKPDHLKPNELDRGHFFLQDPQSLRDFAKAALDIGWFEKLFSWGHLDFLIKGVGKWTEAQGFLADRIVDWMITTPVEIFGKLTEHRATIDTCVFEQFCRRYQDGTAPGVDVRLLRCILEFFRPVIEQRRGFVFASVFVKRIVSDLLDAGYEDDALWLLGIVLRTDTRVSKTFNFDYEAARIEGRSTESIPEYQLRYQVQFECQLAEDTIERLFKGLFLPRVNVIGLKLAHFLTQQFIEIRAIDSRDNKHALGTHYIRSAIEPHGQDSIRKGPVNVILNLLRDCWEALLISDRKQAESVYFYWGWFKDGLIERLRIHALTKMVEAGID